MYYDFPVKYFKLLSKQPNFVILETSRFDQENHHTFLFHDPVSILTINCVSETNKLLYEIQDRIQKGYYVAGYLGYECGAYLENIKPWKKDALNHPLAWFGVYEQPLIFNHQTGKFNISPETITQFATPPSRNASDKYTLNNLRFDLTWPQYQKKIAQIKQYILSGDTYQINLTGRYNFDFTGSPFAFYRTLKKKQPVAYSAYIRTAEQDILCFSPELFFQITHGRITTKPMKGTAPRGRTITEDNEKAFRLQSDEKNHAENAMIVDLLRNDLGRLCRIGSIKLPHLFTVEKYPTLFQMTSTVEGTLSGKPDYPAIFHSLFPCGSVTGAPKIRSMQIIRELETSPRGVYTGTIGFIAPVAKQHTPWQSIFNIAIRTIVLHNGQGTMGIGSGIVYDSEAKSEFEECAIKAAFLTKPVIDFSLLETILWDNGIKYLKSHLSRLNESATYFAYPYNQNQITTKLKQKSGSFLSGQKYKVRLLLDHTGKVICENALIKKTQSKKKTIIISQKHTNSNNIFLYHKTTNRAFYDNEYHQAVRKGHADVIFLNENEEITEGAISNIFIEKNQQLLTPPLSCGLLNGIFRQYILKTHVNAREEVLTLKDLQQADKIYICNTIRGLREVMLVSK